MKNGPNRMCFHPDDSGPALGSRRRRHEGRRLVRFHPACNLAWAFVVGLAAALAATDHALAQEPMVPPPFQTLTRRPAYFIACATACRRTTAFPGLSLTTTPPA